MLLTSFTGEKPKAGIPRLQFTPLHRVSCQSTWVARGWFETEVSQFPGTFPEVQGEDSVLAASTRLETWPPLQLLP